jgi:perosamine synthetase
MQPYEQLEYEWARFNGLDPAGMVACASGTAALHLALECLELPPGSEVIVPDYTMVACARAVTLAGHKPVFIDCEPDDLLVAPYRYYDESSSDDEVGVALMAVHVYGRRVNMDKVAREADRLNAPVVEDLAEAHGVSPHPKTDAACWSFYRNKVVAGAEGGAVWFRDRDRASRARSLRSLGFTDAHDYTHAPRGHNYRMSNVHAGLVLNSMDWYPHNLRRRRELEAQYNAATPKCWTQPARQVPWVYDLRVPGLTADRQRKAVGRLRKAGVGARYGFKPLSSQEEYRTSGIDETTHPNAYSASREVIYLPLDPGLADGDPLIALLLLVDQLHDYL